MLNNNNKGAVNRISLRSMKCNLMRNIFAIVAITLTTLMFTTVFTIGFSLAQNMNTMFIRQKGTRAEISLVHPTKEQVEKINGMTTIDAAGVMIPVTIGFYENNQNIKFTMEYHDDTNFKYNITPALTDLKGNYPDKKDEIMMSVGGLNAIKIEKPEIGMEIPLLVNGEEHIFSLSGYFTDFGFRTNNYDVYVSKEYADSVGVTMEENGYLAITPKTLYKSQYMRDLKDNVILSENQNWDRTFYGDSGGFFIVVAVLLVCGIIVISGYLLIYNIMYISVTKDIRFYGMLKTIGTTPGQIKKIVKNQVLILSAIGIPIGIILGTLVSFVAVPYAQGMFGGPEEASYLMPKDISFNPFIYVGTIFFDIITVMLSCMKPAKLAGKISPVEALKYNGQKAGKIKSKKSTDGGKLYRMSYRNVFREKKRAILVFASLIMGTFALLVTQSFLGSLKLENYVEFYMPDDYTISTENSMDDDYEKLDAEKMAAAEKLVKDVQEIDGINEVMVNHALEINLLFDEELYVPFFEYDKNHWGAQVNQDVDTFIAEYNRDKEGSYTAHIVSVDTKMMERYNIRAERKIDVEAFEKGEICYIGYVEGDEQAKKLEGRTITLINPENGRRRDIKIGLCAKGSDIEFGLNTDTTWQLFGTPEKILVSKKVLDELTDVPNVSKILANCEPEAETLITKQIWQLVKNNNCVPSVQHVKVKSEIMEYFSSSMLSMRILTTGISIVLITIGIVNFINVMLTGVFARRRELAVMESVGMTKRQIRKMLILEGVYYGAITTGFIITVGSVLVYFVAKLAVKVAEYAVFYYPWQMMLCMVLIIIIICVLVPAAVYGQLSKESVTERLRIGE